MHVMALLSLPSICIDQETGANVTVNCVHPGIVRTRLNRDRDGILTGTVRDAHCQLLLTHHLLHEWNNKISFLFFLFLFFWGRASACRSGVRAAVQAAQDDPSGD